MKAEGHFGRRIMWLHEQLGAKDWNGKVHPRYAHAKLDGIRCTAYKQESGELLVFGKDHRPHLEMQARYPRLSVMMAAISSKMMPLSSIDMELTTSGPASLVVSALSGNNDLPLVATAFAVPWWRGINCDGFSLEAVAKTLRDHDIALPFAEYLELPDDEHWSRDELLILAAHNGYEGWVLKDSNYFGWHKLKAVRTVDCVVTRLKAGQGRFTGQVGALVVGVLTPNGTVREIANVGGFDDATRAAVSKSDVGRVVEVEYQYVGAGGRLRHPRFKRWRDDKPQQLCSEDQLS